MLISILADFRGAEIIFFCDSRGALISGVLQSIFSDFRGAEIYFFRFRGPTASKSRTEILKLKELPTDGFETSRGALWLSIGTFLVLSSGIS